MLDIRLCDCMKLMAEYPDKHFELAICDPPYSIKRFEKGSLRFDKEGKYPDGLEWDKKPSPEYFKELFRVSEKQIIWGANNFELPPTEYFIIWDKRQDLTMSDGELAFTSFDMALRRIVMNRCEIYKNSSTIHPTQKPVKLYKWLLENYAKPGDKILDTHLGSGSIAIACHYMGYDLTACELDKDYYEAAMKRIKEETAQISMF